MKSFFSISFTFYNFCLFFVILLTFLILPSDVIGKELSIKEFVVSSEDSHPANIIRGSDGNLWFTEHDGGRIGRITSNGKINEFITHIDNDDTWDITAGPDANLWFTSHSENLVGRITPNGTVTEFSLPVSGVGPYGITAGPDNKIWFSDGENKIMSMTTNGSISEFSVPTSYSGPVDLVVGPDGKIWFTEFYGGKIGNMTTTGVFQEFLLPDVLGNPLNIISGSDGNLWFTAPGPNRIGRITPEGEVTVFNPPTANSIPMGITSGIDGNIWFTEWGGNKIGRITPDGIITEFQIPVVDSTPYGIVIDANGSIWFTELYKNTIARIDIDDVKEPGPPAKAGEILSPFNKDVTWKVTSGYYNNRDQSMDGCHIGFAPDHCRNQLFGFDLVPDQQSDKEILAPANGTIDYKGRLEGGCIGLRIKLDNGLNMNVCHFATFSVDIGKHVDRGKVLGTRNTSHVHLSLDDRHGSGNLCPSTERCYLPVPFSGKYTIEGISLDPDSANGETVILPYSKCDKNINCQFEVGFQQYFNFRGTSTNVAIP